MRIWDVNPGYLNRQSLLGEHRELHGIVAILRDNKKGYSKHPETLRWVGHHWALRQRHRLIVAEMNLRGYVDKSPVLLRANSNVWPTEFIDPPASQFVILKNKYTNIEKGRISIPNSVQQLWAQHKYSVMARDISKYKSFGKRVSARSKSMDMDVIALELTNLLRQPPKKRLIENTVLHMWGYVSKYEKITGIKLKSYSLKSLLKIIQNLSINNNVKYLTSSTALSELDAWSLL